MKQLNLDLPSAGPMVLVDAMNVVYRSHWAFQTLCDSNGMLTGVYYGFLRALLSLRKLAPEIVVCWDNGLPSQKRVPNWRKKIYPEYQAKRIRPVQQIIDVRLQLLELEEVLRVLGWHQVGVPGLEADDLAGILVGSLDRNMFLFTSDRDYYQLLEGERVKVVKPGQRDGRFEIMTQRKIEGLFGISIGRWASYLTLGGDSSDNIRPLPGIGSQRALLMVQDGANPERPFSKQTLVFRRKYVKWEPRWDKVQAAYEVVALPRNWEDPRIREYVKNCKGLIAHPPLLGYKTRLDWFSGFCVRHDLDEFLGKRKEFVR